MRLINIHTLRIEEYFGDKIPPYAILSHTWGEGEVSLQDWNDQDTASRKAGYAKIINTCQQAKVDGIDYAWVDTNCIDKTSSAELSEAINSMYSWYQGSKACYVYLADVPLQQQPPPGETGGYIQLHDSVHDGAHDGVVRVPTFEKSRWFTRGWTLQEFLAPSRLVFYSQEWREIGTKNDPELVVILSRVTDINPIFFMTYIPGTNLPAQKELTEASIAQRMSWMSRRKTTREEDLAYCLLGIFDVNMPLLYGEGQKAFQRLQEEIIRTSNDQSIFCWALPAVYPWSSILAPFPAAFAKSGACQPCPPCPGDTVRLYGFGVQPSPYTLTNCGLNMTVSVHDATYGLLAILQVSSDPLSPRIAQETRLALPLNYIPDRGWYERRSPDVQPIPVSSSSIGEKQVIFLKCRESLARKPTLGHERKSVQPTVFPGTMPNSFEDTLCLLAFDTPTIPRPTGFLKSDPANAGPFLANVSVPLRHSRGRDDAIKVAPHNLGIYLDPNRNITEDEIHVSFFICHRVAEAGRWGLMVAAKPCPHQLKGRRETCWFLELVRLNQWWCDGVTGIERLQRALDEVAAAAAADDFSHDCPSIRIESRRRGQSWGYPESPWPADSLAGLAIVKRAGFRSSHESCPLRKAMRHMDPDILD